MVEEVNRYHSTAEEATVEYVSFRQKALSFLDKIIDFRDSVSRRRQANRIMTLLSYGLISRQEAADRMNDVYARQKKGKFTATLAKGD